MCKQILVVDDDPFQRRIAEKYLTSRGFQVSTVSSAQEGLLFLETHPELIQAIVTDISMPDMDGFAFSRSLQEIYGSKAPPIVFISSHADVQNRVQSYKSGGEYFLAKPWDPDELMAVLLTLTRSRDPGEPEES